MSYGWTAARSVLNTPELLQLVFLELDNPGDFGRVNKTFRAVARDAINIAKHFERRFYPYEIVHELLILPSVYQGMESIIEARLPHRFPSQCAGAHFSFTHI